MKFRCPTVFRSYWFAFCILAFSGSASAVEPLVQFDFENGLKNGGSLGGEGKFQVYARGEEPCFDLGPFGRCLDLTSASRHGGTGTDQPKAGSAVAFRHPALDRLTTFTLMAWHRQNVLVQGPSARLLTKENGWDLLPHANGASLALGPGNTKTTYALTNKTASSSVVEWQFLAVVIEPDRVRAYAGGLAKPLSLCGELPRKETAAAGRGDLLLGTFGGIRPFNGWLDRVRVFGEPLDEAAVRAAYDADRAAAKERRLAPVWDLARPSANTHRFHLKRSDIPFSVRWQKREEAPAVMQSFHTTQCLWVYGDKPDFIRRIKDMGIGYQGTLNGLQGTEKSLRSLAAKDDPTGRHEDLDGNKNTPHWMLAFKPKPFTGCCNHPAFRELFFTAAKKLVDNGVDMLHVDDWAMNASWVLNGEACFCEHCRDGFRDWLKRRFSAAELAKLGVADVASFDYREHLRHNGVADAAAYRAKFRELPLTPAFIDFQVESMRAFFRDFRRQLDEWSPKRYIPVSVNGLLYHLHPNHNVCGVDVVDFFVGESSQNAEHQSAANYLFAAKAAEAFGMSQVVSPIPRNTARTRAALATTYALGQTHLVPWDIYMGSDATGIQPRFFGTREQYGDLYDFVKEHGPLLDDNESAAEIAVLANADAPGALSQFCKQLADRQIQFHLILAASQYARVPVRAADLKTARAVVEFSPADSFCEEDQQTIRTVRETGLVRFVPPTADLAAICRLRDMELLRVEGPENIYAFLRVSPRQRTAAIHLVNWNLGRDAERAEAYGNVTLALSSPQRWGRIASATYHRPGETSVALKPEDHEDCVRLTLPAIQTWGIIEIHAQNSVDNKP